jgi:hypothetical protein
MGIREGFVGSRSDRRSVRAVRFLPSDDLDILGHLPRRRMTETLFLDASSDYNPRLAVQMRSDVDANERKTVEGVVDRPESNSGAGGPHSCRVVGVTVDRGD